MIAAAPIAPAAAPADPAAPAADPAAPAAPAAAPAAPAATPASTGTATPGSSSQGQQTQQSLETQRMLFELYKLQRQDYLKREEKLHIFVVLLYATIGTNFLGYLKNLTIPYLILR